MILPRQVYEDHLDGRSRIVVTAVTADDTPEGGVTVHYYRGWTYLSLEKEEFLDRYGLTPLTPHEI
jgi:hypothetical protein